jgi:hypothetical protein
MSDDKMTQIDAMVAAANAQATLAGKMVEDSATGTRGSFKVELSPDGVTAQGDAKEGTILHDDGRDLDGELNRLALDINQGQAALDEMTYDPKTGVPSPKLSGEARRIAELVNDQKRANHQYSQIRFAKIAEQRETQRRWNEAEQAERSAKFAFTGGDPKREAIWNEEMAREEARVNVQAALARRFERAR